MLGWFCFGLAWCVWDRFSLYIPTGPELNKSTTRLTSNSLHKRFSLWDVPAFAPGVLGLKASTTKPSTNVKRQELSHCQWTGVCLAPCSVPLVIIIYFVSVTCFLFVCGFEVYFKIKGVVIHPQFFFLRLLWLFSVFYIFIWILGLFFLYL